jgi:hypothetical protein
MSMDRRSFFRRALGAVTAAAAVLEIDPERLLWTPTKTFFIPDAPAIKNVKIVPATVADMEQATKGGLEEILRHNRELGVDGGIVRVTSVGRCVFDANMNLVSVGGRPIKSAREAAKYEASMYQYYGHVRMPPQEFEALVERKVVQRMRSGIVDVVEHDDLDFAARFLSREPRVDSGYRPGRRTHGKHRRA